MNSFINYYYDQLYKYEHLKQCFIQILKFMKDVLNEIDDQAIRELFHSLSSTFMPQSLFFLIVNTDTGSVDPIDTNLTADQQKELVLNQQMRIWIDPVNQQKLSLQRAAIDHSEYFCQKIPDCINLICQYLKELLIFSLSDKIEVNSHPFLSHFSHTVLLSRLPIFSRIYASLACIQIVYPILKQKGMKEQMLLIQETIFAAAQCLIEYPMPLIKLIFLIVANTIREEVFIDANKYRYGPIVKLVFSQSLLKECPNVSEVVVKLLTFFEQNTLKYMMQMIIDNSMQVVENSKDATPLNQLVNLNKTWRIMLQNDPKLRTQVSLNYFPVIQAAISKFLQIVELNYRTRIQYLEQFKKNNQKRGSSSQTPNEQQLKDIQIEPVQKKVDVALLVLLRACCFNLQPQIDNQQFVEIEKKLMPLFRQMLDEVLQPYQTYLLKIAESIVIIKKQMTPTTSFALKNLHEIYEISSIVIRVRSKIIFLTYGGDFYKMNTQFLLQTSYIGIKMLQHQSLVGMNSKEIVNVFLLIQILHLNHYNVELQFNISQLLDILLDIEVSLNKECRLQRLVTIMSLNHNYIQQVFEYFGSKERRQKLLEMVLNELSTKENNNLLVQEIKILVCGVSNLFLKYREQFHLTDDQIYQIIIRISNMLFWQKYQHDKSIYFDQTNKNQNQPTNQEKPQKLKQMPQNQLNDNEKEMLTEFFLTEYKQICLDLDEDYPQRLQSSKYYQNLQIALKDYDEYVYFKRYLVLSYHSDREVLRKFLLSERENNYHKKIIEMVLRCKRVRVTRDGNKEYIRFIFKFTQH
eukprot:403373715